MTRFLVVAGLACALAAPAVASAQATGTATPSKQASGMAKGQAQGSALAAADRTFAMDAAMGGMAEVELGKMAAEKGTSSDVKQFGQRMVDDHGKANEELTSWASQNNVKLPAELGPKHKALRDKLMKLTGDAFDKAYMREMVADHNKDVAEFQRASKTLKNDDLKAWAGKTLPTLQEHQRMAKEIASKVGATPDAKK